MLVASGLASGARADDALAKKIGMPKGFDPVAESLRAEGRKDWKKAAQQITKGNPNKTAGPRHGPAAKGAPKVNGATINRVPPGALPPRTQRYLAARQRVLAEAAALDAYNRAVMAAQFRAALVRSGAW